jgi:hypothetical protein
MFRSNPLWTFGATWSERRCRIGAGNAAIDAWKGYGRAAIRLRRSSHRQRHASLLHALTTAGLFTGLFLGSGLVSEAAAAAADHALAVSADAFIYIDTSNEPTDQTVAHEK